jgi:hypothetical protein
MLDFEEFYNTTKLIYKKKHKDKIFLETLIIDNIVHPKICYYSH